MSYIAVANGLEHNSDYYMEGVKLSKLVARVENIIHTRKCNKMNVDDFTVYRVNENDLEVVIMNSEVKEYGMVLTEYDSKSDSWY